MEPLKNKIDFIALISAKDCNPNGDPNNGNRPRTDIYNYGEISHVCIKRKIRNSLQDMGENILIQQKGRENDGCTHPKERIDQTDLKQHEKDKDDFEYKRIACETWFDVRAFGQVFAYSGDKNKGISISITGPVTIQQFVKTVDPVDIIDDTITKSRSFDSTNGNSDTMGENHRIRFGLYVLYGSINPFYAQKNGLTEEDAEKIKKAICRMYENDIAVARPAGSITMERLYWFKHNEPVPATSSKKVFESLKITHKSGIITAKSFDDYDINLELPEGCVTPEIIN